MSFCISISDQLLRIREILNCENLFQYRRYEAVRMNWPLFMIGSYILSDARGAGCAADAATVCLRQNTCRQLLMCFNRCRVNDRIMFSHATLPFPRSSIGLLTLPPLTSTFRQYFSWHSLAPQLLINLNDLSYLSLSYLSYTAYLYIKQEFVRPRWSYDWVGGLV